MNKTDVLTGRIVQRVLDTMNTDEETEVRIVYEVDYTYSVSRLVNNIWEHFPDASITLDRIECGYHMEIFMPKPERR